MCDTVIYSIHDRKNDKSTKYKLKHVQDILELVLVPDLINYKLFVVANALRVDDMESEDIIYRGDSNEYSRGSMWGHTERRPQLLIFGVVDTKTVVLLRTGLD